MVYRDHNVHNSHWHDGHGQVGQATIVMARVLGLLWMRNPLRIVHQGEHKAPVPACTVRAGRRQSKSCKKGETGHAGPLCCLLTSFTAGSAPSHPLNDA